MLTPTNQPYHASPPGSDRLPLPREKPALPSILTCRLLFISHHCHPIRWCFPNTLIRTLIVCVLCFSPGCQEQETAEQTTPNSLASEVQQDAVVAAQQQDAVGHERMLARLAELADWSTTHHPILGDASAKKLRTALKQLQASGRTDADAKRTYPRLLMNLGLAELRLGNVDQAIEHLLNGLAEFRQLPPDNVSPDQLTEVKYQLAIALIRQAETLNCCLHNSPDSCLLPIRGGGVHTQQSSSREAIQFLEEVLSETKSTSQLHIKSKWLLNVMYMTIDSYPEQVPKELRIAPTVFASESEFPKFPNVASQLEVDTFSLLGGAIVEDFDGDNYLDIFVSTFDMHQPPRLYRNNRDGTFTDASPHDNLKGLVGGFNIVHADYDNDGDVDVLMLRGAWLGQAGCIPNSLLRNDGKGAFTDVTAMAGLCQVDYPSQTAAWADYDNDGDLDVYVGNEHLQATDFAPCQLFRNNGDGTFTDIAELAGVTNDRFTKGVTWGDYDNDDDMDLYVSNFAGDNRLYRNNGDSTFTDVAQQTGTTKPNRSFPVWFWDFDNDGNLDLFVSSYEFDRGKLGGVVLSQLGSATSLEHACLYRGDGKGQFQEVAEPQGLTGISLPMGANFGDLDNDGFPDFYLGTGYPDYEALMPNVMYWNKGGTKFTDISSSGGFAHLQKGHAVVFADLDNDGDQDVFEQLGGFFPGDKYYDALFENPGFGNHWISIQLIGVKSNRSAIGARIRAEISEQGKTRSVHKRINSGGSFGANPFRQTVGLGQADHIDVLEVYWPTSGTRQVFRDVSADQVIQIQEDRNAYEPLDLQPYSFASTPK